MVLAAAVPDFGAVGSRHATATVVRIDQKKGHNLSRLPRSSVRLIVAIKVTDQLFQSVLNKMEPGRAELSPDRYFQS